MCAISEEVIQRNEHLREAVGDFTITQFVTRGPGRWGHQAGPLVVCVKVAALQFNRFARYYTEGAHGVIARTRGYSSESLDPKVKHFSRMNFNLAKLEAADVDPNAWPVLADLDGNVTEGTATTSSWSPMASCAHLATAASCRASRGGW
jgi:branched-chain amino acid aminotransferase